MEFPNPKPSREEMIETYLQTLAKVVGSSKIPLSVIVSAVCSYSSNLMLTASYGQGEWSVSTPMNTASEWFPIFDGSVSALKSYEEAKKRMYALSTTTYVGFQAVMTEEMSEKFRGLPGVVFILPDSYLYPETKEYGGDKYENGVITPRPPPVQYSKLSRNDRNRNYRGNYENSPPPQGNYQNSPPPHGNYQNRSPPQGNFQGSRPQQEVRGYAPQQNYTQAGQDGRGYGRNDSADRPGYNAPGGYQGRVNEAGQGFQDPQERRSFSQGQEGDLRPGGPSAPGNYGQPPAPGNYGQPPAPGNYGQPSAPGSYGKPFGPPAYGQPSGSRYAGGNQGGPGYGGDNRQGAAPAYGGDNLQGVSDQYPSPGEGQQGN
ncbi:unnamed protein product [Triticum turgidum subsp. durum]|uniref:MORF/ORRM1/DAG-like MORF domain-containing protein n=1 Tax=Triticum turgidum subsp. durum TaxID=4567 RepID=A0A9R0SEZ4_TRITD|nr:unnamed protein product [Triticum turgidum subsp. durum]